MKKYTVLNKDLSQLVSEADGYLTELSSPAYRAQLYHKTGPTADLVTDIPSLATAFDAENLTASGLAHWSIDTVVRAVDAPCPILIVPLKNTGNCTFNVVELKPGALSYKDYSTDHDYYNGLDCNILETITITAPVFVNTGTVYAIENSNYNLAEFIIIAFNEDVSSYFAE